MHCIIISAVSLSKSHCTMFCTNVSVSGLTLLSAHLPLHLLVTFEWNVWLSLSGKAATKTFGPLLA